MSPSVRAKAGVLAGLLGCAAVLTGCGAGSGSTAQGTVASASPGSSTGSSTRTPSATAPAPSATTSAPAAVPTTLRFSATTVEGARFRGAQLAGKPAVLWFWAPWCPTCRGQIPTVSSLAGEYGDRVQFVGVGSLDQSAAIKGFAEDVPAQMTQLTDPGGSLWRHFGITEQSTFVLLDAQGTVVRDGYLSASALARAVADLAG